MKNLILSIFLIGVLGSAQAQNKIKDLTFGVNTGVSIPVSDLQSSSDSENSGFGENGFFMNFTGNYKVNSSWSLVGMLYYNQNTIDDETMQPHYLNELGGAMEDIVTSGDRLESDLPDWEDEDNIVYDSDDWMITSFLVGGKYTLPIKRFTLEGQAVAGFQYSLLPIHTLQVRDVSKPYLWAHQSTKDTDFSLAAMISASIRMPLTARTQLKFSVDYYYSRIDMEYEITEFTGGTVSNRTDNMNIVSYKLNYATLNAGLGIIYNF